MAKNPTGTIALIDSFGWIGSLIPSPNEICEILDLDYHLLLLLAKKTNEAIIFVRIFTMKPRLQSSYLYIPHFVPNDLERFFVKTAINFWTQEIELGVDKRGDPVCFRSVAITRAEGGGGESGSASGKRRRWKTRVVFSAREITIRPRGRREERLSVSEAETPRGFAKALGFPPTPVHCCTLPLEYTGSLAALIFQGSVGSLRVVGVFASVQATNFPRDPRISIVSRIVGGY